MVDGGDVAAALVTGGTSLLGGILSSNAQSDSAAAANATNIALAEQNRVWSSHEADVNRNYQTQMSNTAYQRATADMKAAGINPMLAIQQGGASSPSGSLATSNPARVDPVTRDYGKPLQEAVSQAVDSYSSLAQARANDAQASLSEAQAQKVSADLPAKKFWADKWNTANSLYKSAAGGLSSFWHALTSPTSAANFRFRYDQGEPNSLNAFGNSNVFKGQQGASPSSFHSGRVSY